MNSSEATATSRSDALGDGETTPENQPTRVSSVLWFYVVASALLSIVFALLQSSGAGLIGLIPLVVSIAIAALSLASIAMYDKGEHLRGAHFAKAASVLVGVVAVAIVVAVSVALYSFATWGNAAEWADLVPVLGILIGGIAIAIEATVALYNQIKGDKQRSKRHLRRSLIIFGCTYAAIVVIGGLVHLLIDR